jgi:hypothetical protein
MIAYLGGFVQQKQKTGLPAHNQRHKVELIAIAQWRVQALVETYVLIIDVDADHRAEAAILQAQVRR